MRRDRISSGPASPRSTSAAQPVVFGAVGRAQPFYRGISTAIKRASMFGYKTRRNLPRWNAALDISGAYEAILEGRPQWIMNSASTGWHALRRAAGAGADPAAAGTAQAPLDRLPRALAGLPKSAGAARRAAARLRYARLRRHGRFGFIADVAKTSQASRARQDASG